MAAVEFRKLNKGFGRQTVVRDLDLSIRDGEFVVLVGPSGCGKSTTLRMLAGLESPTSGEILIGGAVVNHLQPRQRDVAMVFQDYALYPHKTVRDNLGFGLKMRGLPRAEAEARIDEAARMLGIEALLDRRPGALSGGQRQRVAMGRAIVRRPQVFLFDEPLSNLDARLRMQVRAEIKRLHQELATTTLYVTHDQVEAMTLAERIVILREGRIEQVGTPAEIYDRPANTFVGGFIGAPAMNFLTARMRGRMADCGTGVLLDLSQVPQAPQDGAPVTIGLRPEHLHAGTGPGIAFSAPVQLVEPLGSDTLAHLAVGGVLLTARLDPRQAPRPGARLDLHVAPADLRLFDATTGLALR